MKVTHSGSFCLPCWAIAALALAWVLGSTWWYVCVLRHTCAPRHERRIDMKPAVLPQAPQPANTWAEVTAKPLTLYFEANSDKVLTQDVATKLTDIVTYMKAQPSAKIMLTGHTNVHSSQAYTNQLGLTRAQAVKDMLVSLGAPADQIMVESKGQTELAASPATAEGRYLNRRVVVSVVQ